MASSTRLTQLSTVLTSSNLPSFSPLFLNPILSSSTAPIPSLAATARLRAFASDIASKSPPILLPSAPSLPANPSSANTQSLVLRDDVFVQVLDIEDLGRSKWEQIESLTAERNGEMKRGREIIRVVPVDEEGDPSSAATQAPRNAQAASQAQKGPFKLLLQDHIGNVIWGFELKKFLPQNMGIGCKILLRKGCKVARGMVLLEPDTVMVFGGKIEVMDKVWRDGREARLRREVEGEEGARRD